MLRRVALDEDVDWALVLAVLQTRGQLEARPMLVRVVARQLAGLGARRHPIRATLRLSRRRAFLPGPVGLDRSAGSDFAERVTTLAAFNSAVGLRGLVHGVHAVKSKLVARVLRNRALHIYPGGRADVRADRVDPRVLLLMLTLAKRYRDVSVTSLVFGHATYTKSGSVSAHSYGCAVDISALAGTPVLGSQQPEGVVEGALRTILLLPDELRPKQLISLFALGGPSFALPDHHDHVHVGY